MVNFDCNLDLNSNCSGSFENIFVPIDTKFKFRTFYMRNVPTLHHNTTDDTYSLTTKQTRVMYTYTGVRILTVVGGKAGIFNFGALGTTFGAGIGLLSIA